LARFWGLAKLGVLKGNIHLGTVVYFNPLEKENPPIFPTGGEPSPKVRGGLLHTRGEHGPSSKQGGGLLGGGEERGAPPKIVGPTTQMRGFKTECGQTK